MSVSPFVIESDGSSARLRLVCTDSSVLVFQCEVFQPACWTLSRVIHTNTTLNKKVALSEFVICGY